jgi:hypothetical protein
VILAETGDVVATGGVVGLLGMIAVEFLRRSRDVDARADATSQAAIDAANARAQQALDDLAEARKEIAYLRRQRPR